jgi:hypothetical protein
MHLHEQSQQILIDNDESFSFFVFFSHANTIITCFFQTNAMLRFSNVDEKPVRLPPVYGYHSHPSLPLQQALDPITAKIQGLNQYIKIAKTECHFPSEHGLTRDESAAIYIYTMDWGDQSLYRELNKILRIEDRSVLVPWYGYLKLFRDNSRMIR